MKEFEYYEEPVKRSVEVKNCKLCGTEPDIKKGSFGYCSAGITIECKCCGIKKHESGDFNNGGVDRFYISVINSWNGIMS